MYAAIAERASAKRRRGHFQGSIMCPYHAWTYGLDGALKAARNMGDVPGFDKADYPLRQAAIACWEGFLFVNLADDPEPFETRVRAADRALREMEYRRLADGAHRSTTNLRATGSSSFRTIPSATTARSCIRSSTSSRPRTADATTSAPARCLAVTPRCASTARA